MPSRYDHHQTQLVIPAIVGAAALVFLVLAVTVDGGFFAGGGTFTLATVVGLAFSRLNTSVDSEELRARFRFGLPRRTIPISDIVVHEPVRNRWWYGIGLRWIPGGVLYNVWGLDAVEVHFRSGSATKKVRIGTDDVTGLDRALTRARG